MHGIFGQTFGKMLFKVKVVDISESPLTLKKAFWRELLSLMFIGFILSN
jgi:uncharacterized RDD family membrane protein YckC